ncbi:BMP family lipoprotein [Gryllotalpicola protaetiae]|uniref:BMP family ABC transporter substrate-binding protein n=1 Tax=Gryllotalpicola protaetiae TaxID=2419771 RepID=A0A387BQA0_9MICO|nr:BMP family ABC transporter substrate-binding protein [Gryllotalpicola protaetiae]AYG04244.1 BMP family ABC transporter substrate-binding protein [Gryllotalpicola protaetiae]
MKITARKVIVSAIAVAGGVALLAGCAQAPSTSSGGSTTAKKSDFLPCMISDSGGFDDHSFNELGYNGLQDASKALGVKPKTAESKTDADYAPNISSMVSQNCNLIITVGFNLADATKAAAAQNPDTNFAIIDDNSITADNVQPIIFDTAQAAFLGGYAAASFSKSGVVGTFGGMQIPTVTIFMDGFADGVAYFNKQKNKDVKVVGWNVDSQKGSFTGGFDANDTAQNTAQGIIDQGADVIMPVGGPIYQSAATAIKNSGKSIALIGVDADVYNTDPSVRSILLTSVMKGIQPSVENVVKSAAAGKFSNTPYVGTLKNDGVGLAPFHDFESKVDPGLQGEIDKIKAGIIDGSITVNSPASPKS